MLACVGPFCKPPCVCMLARPAGPACWLLPPSPLWRLRKFSCCHKPCVSHRPPYFAGCQAALAATRPASPAANRASRGRGCGRGCRRSPPRWKGWSSRGCHRWCSRCRGRHRSAAADGVGEQGVVSGPACACRLGFAPAHDSCSGNRVWHPCGHTHPPIPPKPRRTSLPC